MSIFFSVSWVCLETSLEESQSVKLPQYGVPMRGASIWITSDVCFP